MAAAFATLACCLLAFSSALTTTLGPAGSAASNGEIQQNEATIPSSSTSHSTPDTNLTTYITGNTKDSMTTTPATSASAESTSSLLTSPSVTPTASPTTSVQSPTMTTATAEFTTPAELTTTATLTPGGDTSSMSASTVNPASSSHTVSAASSTVDGATEASRLHGSEKYITIVFSVTLGAVAVVLSVWALCRCHLRRQFAHQPLDECGDMRTFVSDDDTLVISGGLYDAHPIYDNVPTPLDDQYEYSLEFYH